MTCFRLKLPFLVLAMIILIATNSDHTVLGKNEEEAKGAGTDKEDAWIANSVSSALGRKMVSAQLHLDKDETGAKPNDGNCIRTSDQCMLGTLLPFSSDYLATMALKPTLPSQEQLIIYIIRPPLISRQVPELYSEKIMDSTTKMIQGTRKIGVFRSDDTVVVLSKANINGKQHLDDDDAVTEMFNMLNKDYQTKAHRRPPINNRIPRP